MKFAISLLFVLLSPLAQAAGDATAGKTKAATCIACHGANGVGIAPMFPNLAGQKAAYIETQLKAFKSGARKGGNSAQMAPMVSALSDQDMADLAAFFASLPPAK